MKIIKCLLIFLVTSIECSQVLAQKPDFMNSLGIQTYTYRNSMKNGIAPVLDTIKSLGLSIIESGINPEGITAEAYKKLLDERNMQCVSTFTGYEELMKDPSDLAHQSKILGAKYLMVAWIPHEGQFDLKTAKKTVADFNKVGKILKDSGITFCYHTHGFEFGPYQDGTLFDYIAKNTDPRYVSFQMDILWVYFGGQDPAKLLMKYPGRFKLMHVKDLRKGVKGDLTGGTDTENNVTVGTGQLNIPGILAAAKKSGVKYYFIEDESSRIRTQVPATISYLKTHHP